MADFTLKAGDTSPALAVTLTDEDGAALDVTGADVRFQMRPVRDEDAALTVDAPATIVSGSDGEVEYAWSPEDTATPGEYIAEFDVTYQDGSRETVPNDGWLYIAIHETLD